MRRERLIRARKAAGKSQEKVGEMVGVDRTAVSKWERNEATPYPDQRKAYADALGVTLEDLDMMLSDLPREDGTSLTLRQYLGMEQSASSMRTHEPHVVHGLLQTPAYAAAIARSVGVGHTPDSYVERNVEQREGRQRRVNDGSLDLHVIQSEMALRLRLGDDATMAEQMRRLVGLGQQQNVTIQVVPFSVGQYEALRLGPMDLMTHAWAEGVTAYIQSYGDQQVIDSPDEVQHFIAAFDHASSVALSPADSLAFIAEAANQWEREQ